MNRGIVARGAARKYLADKAQVSRARKIRRDSIWESLRPSSRAVGFTRREPAKNARVSGAEKFARVARENPLSAPLAQPPAFPSGSAFRRSQKRKVFSIIFYYQNY